LAQPGWALYIKGTYVRYDRDKHTAVDRHSLENRPVVTRPFSWSNKEGPLRSAADPATLCKVPEDTLDGVEIVG